MKAIQINRPGGPEVLEPASVPSPSPGPSEVLIQVEAAGVNFIDTYHRTGAYPVQLPFIPGVEGGGTVAEVGSAVEGVKEGDRVTYSLHLGSYAEKATVPAAVLLPVPDEVDTGLSSGGYGSRVDSSLPVPLYLPPNSGVNRPCPCGRRRSREAAGPDGTHCGRRSLCNGVERDQGRGRPERWSSTCHRLLPGGFREACARRNPWSRGRCRLRFSRPRHF